MANRNMVIIEDWIANGLFIMDEDGAPSWSKAAVKNYPAHVRDLIYYIPYGGIDKFKKVCSDCGYKSEKILDQCWLDENGLCLGDS